MILRLIETDSQPWSQGMSIIIITIVIYNSSLFCIIHIRHPCIGAYMFFSLYFVRLTQRLSRRLGASAARSSSLKHDQIPAVFLRLCHQAAGTLDTRGLLLALRLSLFSVLNKTNLRLAAACFTLTNHLPLPRAWSGTTKPC